MATASLKRLDSIACLRFLLWVADIGGHTITLGFCTKDQERALSQFASDRLSVTSLFEQAAVTAVRCC